MKRSLALAAACALACLSPRAAAQQILVLEHGMEAVFDETSPPVQVALLGGRLVLEGAFDRLTEHPLQHPTRFDNVQLLGTPQGTLRFVDCALVRGESSHPDSSRFDELPLAYSDLRLELSGGWLYGAGDGLFFDTNHRGSLRADGTWFSASDTSVISLLDADTARFEGCRFAWSTTGLAVHDAVLAFRDCEFVSLDLAVAVSGRGRLDFERCLFQSCGTMLQLGDSVDVALDSCSFYEVGEFCLQAPDPGARPRVTATNCWFDPKTAPFDRRVFGLPDSLLLDTLAIAPKESVKPMVIDIYVDDSEPLENGDRVLRLGAAISIRDGDGAPIRARQLRLYALSTEEAAPDSFHAFRSDPEFRRGRLRAEIDVQSLPEGPLPLQNGYRISLPPDTLSGSGWWLLGTVDDGFPEPAGS